mmetsp:Transcript_24420/g.52563  ORF Transcript_24420/g.52563 Transcript_24420/m.52563 type:complete len:187 (-) Transcript_24420:606-1166(-)
MERAALKGTSAASRAAVRPRQALAGRLNVVAMAKKVTKKVEVVLSKDVANVGTVGEVKKVTLGHAKNFLIPNGLAEPVTEQVMSKIKAEQERAAAAKEAEKENANKIKTALNMVKNFNIKKEANDENTYGSVTFGEVFEVVKKQTGIELSQDSLDMPAMKELGVFTVTANLHKEVQAEFTITVQKA